MYSYVFKPPKEKMVAIFALFCHFLKQFKDSDVQNTSSLY